MKRLVFLLTLPICISASNRTVVANIIVDQPPNLTGGPASDLDFLDNLGRRSWQREADDLQLNEDAVLEHLRFWGFYGGDGTPATPPPTPETIEVRFMGARPGDGLPDESSILFDQSYLNPLRVATGRILAGIGGRPAEQVYDVDLVPAVHLQAGSLYWLEVVQMDDVSTMFRWEAGHGLLDGHSFDNPLTNGWYWANSTSLSFQLSDVPEPEMFAAILFGASFLHRWPRQARDRLN